MSSDGQSATANDLRDRLNAAICAAAGRGAAERDPEVFARALSKAREAKSEAELQEALEAVRSACP